MRSGTQLLMSAVLLSAPGANVSVAQGPSGQAGRLGAAVSAVVHYMEPELVHALISGTQEPWPFTVSSPDSADWGGVFERLRPMLHARAAVPGDGRVHYLEIGETRISDTASVFGITIGIEFRCTGRGGGSTISDISTTVPVSRTNGTWGWHSEGPSIIADRALCPP